MRDDLLDANAAIEWAVAQLPVLNDRIVAWKKASPYAAIRKLDLDRPRTCFVIGEKFPLDRMVQAEAGAIINSLRSSLDLAAARCAIATGKKPDISTHFPFFSSLAHFTNPDTGLNSEKYKKWISKDDRAVIESFKPYEGENGNWALCAIHQLDILRKHERFIMVDAPWKRLRISGGTSIVRGKSEVFELLPRPMRVNGEAVIAYIPDNMSNGKPHATFEITFAEPASMTRKILVPSLEAMAGICKKLLESFR